MSSARRGRRPVARAILALSIVLAACSLERTGLAPDRGQPSDSGDLRDAGPERDAAPPDATTDRDGDGVPDDADSCPDVADDPALDADGDGIADACDPDPDGDGLIGERDLCPRRDSRGTPDEDGDGVADECDLCPLDPDAEQPNDDGDRLGDACERDDRSVLSRVAVLYTFDTAPGDLLASSASVFTFGGGGLHVDTSSRQNLHRARDDAFPSTYSVDVRATFDAEVGAFPDPEIGIVTRLAYASASDFEGFKLTVRVDQDVVYAYRANGDGCFGLCEDELLIRDLGFDIDTAQPFAMRADASGEEILFHVRRGTDASSWRIVDSAYAEGGFALIFDEIEATVTATAVYAP